MSGIEHERITLRIPKDVHRELSRFADAQSRSLNAEIVTRLRSTLQGSEGFTAEDRALIEEIRAGIARLGVADDQS